MSFKNDCHKWRQNGFYVLILTTYRNLDIHQNVWNKMHLIFLENELIVLVRKTENEWKSYKRIEKLSSLSRRIGDRLITLEFNLLGGCVAIPYPTCTFLGGCHPISRPLIATCSWFILLVDCVKSHRRWILIFRENSAETLLFAGLDNFSKSAWLDLSLEVLFGAFCSKIRLFCNQMVPCVL